MSSLGAIFAFIGEVVVKILKFSVDVITFALAVAAILCALVLPYRWPEVYSDFDETFNIRILYKWSSRQFCYRNFFITVFDFFTAVPIIIIGILSPYRADSLCLLPLVYNIKEPMGFRLFLAHRSVVSIWDFCRSFSILLLVLSPMRLFSVCKFRSKLREIHFYTAAKDIPVISENGEITNHSFSASSLLEHNVQLYVEEYNDYKERIIEFASFHGLLAIVDIITLPCLIGVMMPSLWPTYREGLAAFNLELDLTGKPIILPTQTTDNPLYYYNRYHNFQLKDYMSAIAERELTKFAHFRFFLINQGRHFFIDIMALPFALVALCSLKHAVYIGKLKETKIEYDALPVNPLDLYSVADFAYCYKYRAITFKFGFLAMCDVLVIPLLLPIFLCRYRYLSIKDEIDFNKSWGYNELYLISTQALFQLLDLIILLPTVPFLFITRIRWKPLEKLLMKEHVFKYETLLIYETAVVAFGELLKDAILFIPFCFLLITHYRSEAVWFVWSNFDELNRYFHESIIKNVSFMLCDAILAVLLLLTCAISPVRAYLCYQRITRFCLSNASKWRQNFTNSLPESGVLSAELPLPFLGLTDGEVGLREFVLGNFCKALLDIPVSILFIILLVTVWRAQNIISIVTKLITTDETVDNNSIGANMITVSQSSINNSISVPVVAELAATNVITTDETVDKKKTFEIYAAVFSEILLLLRDIFFLFPMIFIIATLYRLPGVLIEMVSKLLSGNPLLSTPIFRIQSCQIDCPDVGGPMLSFKVSLNKNSDSFNDMTNVCVSDGCNMHVVGNDFWKDISSKFGSSIAALGRSMFPWKLVDDKSIDLRGLQSQMTSLFECRDNNEESVQFATMWAKLDIGKTKRSTVLKKLKLLANLESMTMQFECSVALPEGKKKKVVLFRLTPTVKQLIEIVERGSGEMKVESLNTPENLDPAAGDDREKNFVNSFYLIVAKHFMEIMLDLGHLAMFIGCMMSPWRMVQLLRTLLEPEYYYPLRVAEAAVETLAYSDMHILNYRSDVSPHFNEICKICIADRLCCYNALLCTGGLVGPRYVAEIRDQGGRLSSDPYIQISVSIAGKAIREAGDHLKEYSKLRQSTGKSVQGLDGCEEVSALMEARRELHEGILDVWSKRFLAPLLFTRMIQGRFAGSNADSDYEVIRPVLFHKVDDDVQGAVILALNERNSKLASNLIGNRVAIDSAIEGLKARCTEKSSALEGSVKKKIGVFSRSVVETRKLILAAFKRSFTDVGFVVLLIGIVLSLFGALPLLRDLANSGSFSPVKYSTRFLLKKHARSTVKTIRNFAKFMLYTCMVFAFGVGVPSYLQELPSHWRSLDDAAEFAKIHFGETCYYLCELLLFITYCRTYVLVFKSSFYAFLVPAGCLAAGQPFHCIQEMWQTFSIGLVVWVALIAGSICTSVVSYSAGNAGDSNYSDSNLSLLAISASLVGVLLIAVIAMAHNPVYTKPNSSAKKSISLCWGHILAVLSGPMEALQLCAVVMFFFYGSKDTQLGADAFSSSVMGWGGSGDGEAGYQKSGSVAAALVILWALLVTVPIANREDRPDDRSVTSSPLHNVCSLLISRIFAVWIVATLMRSSSCVQSSSGENVMSTAETVLCGGGSFWSGLVSVPLLVYFIITSSILHSDDAYMLQLNYASDETLVTFAPLYSLLVRAGQLFVCAASFGGFYELNVGYSLGPIIAVSALMMFLPLFFRSGSCSIEAISPLRSSGWACVLWTSILCMARSASGTDSAFLSSELAFYMGWLVIYAIGITSSIVVEVLASRAWERELMSSGLRSILDGMLRTCDNLLVDDGLVGYRRRKEQGSRFKNEITRARSAAQLLHVLLSFESHVLLSRLSEKFLLRRTRWVCVIRELIQQSTGSTAAQPQNPVGPRDQGADGSGSGLYDIELQVPGAAAAPSNMLGELAPVQAMFAELSAAITKDLHVVQVSRDVLSILLKRLPSELVWYIYSHCIDMHSVRERLFTPLSHVGIKFYGEQGDAMAQLNKIWLYNGGGLDKYKLLRFSALDLSAPGFFNGYGYTFELANTCAQYDLAIRLLAIAPMYTETGDAVDYSYVGLENYGRYYS